MARFAALASSSDTRTVSGAPASIVDGASMASANHAWWEGMYLVSRNFYSKFLPQVKAVAGAEGDALIQKYVKDVEEHHGWLGKPEKGNPILGYGLGKQEK